MRRGRGFRGVVVAHEREYAPCFEVPAKLAWRKTSPVRRRRSLAVPEAEHAVVLALAAQLRLLRAQTAVAAMSSLMPGWKRMS